MRFAIILSFIALFTSACASDTCVPDGQPACECTPDESRQCTTDAGEPGLELCGSNGQWGACAAFTEGGSPTDATPLMDVMLFDTGHATD